jgi:hypothetical protein
MAKKKFTIIAERTFIHAWTYSVLAENYDEALELVEDCPDGECDDIYHHDDENVYSDSYDIEYSLDDEQDLDEEELKKLEEKYKK